MVRSVMVGNERSVDVGPEMPEVVTPEHQAGTDHVPAGNQQSVPESRGQVCEQTDCDSGDQHHSNRSIPDEKTHGGPSAVVPEVLPHEPKVLLHPPDPDVLQEPGPDRAQLHRVRDLPVVLEVWVSVEADGDRPFLLSQASDMDEGVDVSDGEPHGNSAHEESRGCEHVFHLPTFSDLKEHGIAKRILRFSSTFLPISGIKLQPNLIWVNK